MMGRLKLRMETQAVWDQTAYNEEMWYATLPGGAPPAVSSRVMSFLCNMNTKVLFRYMLSDAELMAAHRPVSVHVNYHPEKLPRMQDVFERYHGLGPDLGGGLGKPTPRSKDGGLDAWHWGVGLKAGRWCRELKRYRHGERLTQSKLGQRLLREAGNGVSWAGIKSLQFRAGGVVTTPWGSGSWGVTSHGDGGERPARRVRTLAAPRRRPTAAPRPVLARSLVASRRRRRSSLRVTWPRVLRCFWQRRRSTATSWGSSTL